MTSFRGRRRSNHCDANKRKESQILHTLTPVNQEYSALAIANRRTRHFVVTWSFTQPMLATAENRLPQNDASPTLVLLQIRVLKKNKPELALWIQEQTSLGPSRDREASAARRNRAGAALRLQPVLPSSSESLYLFRWWA